MPAVCELTPDAPPKEELMVGGMGHIGGLTNPRPWRGRCQAGYSNTGGPPKPRKWAPCQKKQKGGKKYFQQVALKPVSPNQRPQCIFWTQCMLKPSSKAKKEVKNIFTKLAMP